MVPARQEPPAGGSLDKLNNPVDRFVSGKLQQSGIQSGPRAGREVLVFEAEQPGFGASSRNGGYVAKVSMRDFSELVARIGLKRTIRLYNEGKEARAYLEDLLEREQIVCHYKSPGRLTVAHTPKMYEALARELEFKRQHGRQLSLTKRIHSSKCFVCSFCVSQN